MSQRYEECEHDFEDAITSITALIRSIEKHRVEKLEITEDILRRWQMTAVSVKFSIAGFDEDSLMGISEDVKTIIQKGIMGGMARYRHKIEHASGNCHVCRRARELAPDMQELSFSYPKDGSLSDAIDQAFGMMAAPKAPFTEKF